METGTGTHAPSTDGAGEEITKEALTQAVVNLLNEGGEAKMQVASVLDALDEFKPEPGQSLGDAVWEMRVLFTKQRDEARAERDKLQNFKIYVHQRLDKAGVPTNPEPEENVKHGCRIEGRLNWMLLREDDVVQKIAATDLRHKAAAELAAERDSIRDERNTWHEEHDAQVAVNNKLRAVLQICIEWLPPRCDVEDPDDKEALSQLSAQLAVFGLKIGTGE